MTRFVDDRPRRALVEGLPVISEEAPQKVTLITSPMFFLQRDKNWMPRVGEFAETVLEGLLAKRPEGVVMVVLHTSTEWMRERMEAAGFRIFLVKEGEASETTIRLKQTLLDLGIRFRPIRNTRTVSYLNIHKFARNNLVAVGADDYATLGIEPEKEITFQDMVKKRARKAWP